MRQLKERKADIIEVYNTTIQQNLSALEAYKSYYADIYNIFSDKADKVKIYNLFSFNVSKIKCDDDVKAMSLMIYSVCFKEIFEKKLVHKYCNNINYVFVPVDLFVPFINFTLIEYENGDCESIWGWYVGQSNRDISEDASFIELKDEEIYARSSSRIIFDNFKGIYKVVRWNWLKLLSDLPSFTVKETFYEEERVINHLNELIQASHVLLRGSSYNE